MNTIVKVLLLLAGSSVSLTTSCVPVPVPADLESVDLKLEEGHSITTGRSIVILAVNEFTPPAEQLDCVRSSFKETEPDFPLLDSQMFLDSTFPWFEPPVVPRNKELLAETMSRIGVKEVIDTLSAKYMVLVGDIHSLEGDIEGPWGPRVMMPAGVGWVEESAEMGASIWDLEQASLVGNISVKATGETLLATWLVTVAFMPMTESKACEELGRQLALFMTG